MLNSSRYVLTLICSFMEQQRHTAEETTISSRWMRRLAEKVATLPRQMAILQIKRGPCSRSKGPPPDGTAFASRSESGPSKSLAKIAGEAR